MPKYVMGIWYFHTALHYCTCNYILLFNSINFQGSQRPGKSWKTWIMKNAFSRPGKIMEFEKNGQNHGKTMEFQNTSMELNPKINIHNMN